MRRRVMEKIKAREALLYPGRKPRKKAERVTRIPEDLRASLTEAEIEATRARLVDR